MLECVPGGRRAAGRNGEPTSRRCAESGVAVQPVNHLATMADLHRAGSYDRVSNDVFTQTGRGPLSVQEFVRKSAARFKGNRKKGLSVRLQPQSVPVSQ